MRARRPASFKSDDLPAVGDWVGFDPASTWSKRCSRGAPRSPARRSGTPTREQVLAANIDVAFLVQALPLDFNLRRLERYLAMAWESGAQPIVLLTKTDLVDDIARYLAEVETVTLGSCPALAVSAKTGAGLERPAAVARAEPHRRPARVVGRRQVDDRERARR